MIKALTQKEYRENFAGFAIKSIVYRTHRNTFVCTLVEDPDYHDKNLPIDKAITREGDFIYRFLNFKLEPKHLISYMELEDWKINRALVVYSKESDVISVDSNGMAWEVSKESFSKWPGYSIPQTDPTKAIKPNHKKKAKKGLMGLQLNAPDAEWGFPKGRLRYIKELKVIDDVVYACGGVRKVLRRDGYNKWTDITLMEEHPQLQKEYLDAQKEDEKSPLIGSFNSMDGFSSNDIYACGNAGDFWHYKGKTWIKINMPNMELNKVVCANDGYVYVAARDGIVFKGRQAYERKSAHWEMLDANLPELDGNPFEGAAWFKDKLYLSTSYGLYELTNSKIQKVNFGKEVQHSFQHVVANNGILISYGPYNALTFDGTEWQTIVSSLVK